MLKIGAVAVMCAVAFAVVRASIPRASNSLPPASSNQPLSGEQVYERLTRSSALIVTLDGLGSGVIVHTEKRLVVTNHHVVWRESKVAVIFPLYDAKGELITDARKYEAQTKGIAIQGEVIGRDEERDLALIRVERLPERTAAVHFARQPAGTGSVVYSVGGSGADDNLLWRLTKGNVRGRVERRQESRTGAIDCMILETDAPVNPGDSGGPVVNDRGELVGVVSHYLTRSRQVSGNIDLEEVRKFVSKHSTSR